jgi:hypothetical protein
MSSWGRVLGAGCGIAMVVGGLLVLGGSRWGWVLGACAALIFIGWLAAGRRFG